MPPKTLRTLNLKSKNQPTCSMVSNHISNICQYLDNPSLVRAQEEPGLVGEGCPRTRSQDVRFVNQIIQKAAQTLQTERCRSRDLPLLAILALQTQSAMQGHRAREG